MGNSVKLVVEPQLAARESSRVFGLSLPSPWKVAALAATLIFLLRLPMSLVPRELNPDEGQMLSQAMKFLVDPVPWRSVDPTTSGPLNSYLLALPLLLGFRPGFLLAHFLGAILACLQVVVAHRTLLHLGSEKTAAIGAGLICVAYGLAINWDYAHYASELAPALLLMCGFHALAVWLRHPSRPRSTTVLFACGLAWGAAPWCKLQALPISGALGGIALLAIFFSSAGAGSQRSRLLQRLSFCAGAFLPAVTMFVVLVRYGVLKDFWYSYILGGLAYAGPLSLKGMLLRLWSTVDYPPLLIFVLLSTFSVGLLGINSKSHEIRDFFREHTWIVFALLTYVAASIFAVVRPNSSFIHYQLFLVPPMSYVTALLLSREGVRNTQGQLSRPKTAAQFKTFACAVLLAAAGLSILFQAGAALSTAVATWHWARSGPDTNEAIAGVVAKVQQQRPVRSLAIWGWTPGVYVLTGIPPATRDAIGHFAPAQHELQPYFRSRFVGDLRASKPDLFIDASTATASWEWKVSEEGYESDPELNELVQNDYVPVAAQPLTAGTRPVRFFARRK